MSELYPAHGPLAVNEVYLSCSCGWNRHNMPDETWEAHLEAKSEQRPALAEAVERIRSNHDKTLGHSPTNLIGYCALPDGISATYCVTGILLAALR